MQQDFEVLCQQISDAYRPEDLFGVEEVLLPPETLIEYLEVKHQGFVAQVSAGLDLEFHDMAQDALLKLKQLYDEALAKVKRFHYGMLGYNQARPLLNKKFSIGHNQYFVGASLERSNLFELFQGYLERAGEYLGEVEIKLASMPTENHYLQREARAIDLLHREAVPQWKHLPYLLDRFETGGRIGLVYRKAYGLSLTTVRKKRAQLKGVDQKHIAWMLDRTFSALGYVHRCGLVHGALSPNSILIDYRLHNALLAEWGNSVLNPARTGEKVLFEVEQYNPFLAPEVIEAGAIGPWSDIFALGKTMIWCLGGDPATNSIPNKVEDRYARFLLSLVQVDHNRRPADCWELYAEHCSIRDALWSKQFLHFDVS